MNREIVIPVILCGGSGTRLWPASRENHPKQFLSLMDDFSLLQNTIRRALRVSGAHASSLVVVTLSAMANSVKQQLAEIDPDATAHILCEPSARNTGAAVALAANYVATTFGPDAVMWVLPSDHHIAREDVLARAYQNALPAAIEGNLVTFGITPSRPDTGYGYIRVNADDKTPAVSMAEHFCEKPDLETAKSYLAEGNYLWNSGMFLFTAAHVLAHYNEYASSIQIATLEAMTKGAPTRPDAAAYAAIEKQPFDKAIMEKSNRVAVVPCDPHWSDVGTWESLFDIRDKDMNGNVIDGRAATHNASGCFIQGKDRLIAVAGLDDLVIVETDDALLITNKNDPASMQGLVAKLKSSGAREAIDPPAPQQPAQAWTMVKSLSDKTYNTREITIAPGQHKSFAAQDAGFCLYTVLEGDAAIACGSAVKTLSAFESADVQSGMEYTITNCSDDMPLKMLEVQKTAQEGIFFGTKPSAANASRKVA